MGRYGDGGGGVLPGEDVVMVVEGCFQGKMRSWWWRGCSMGRYGDGGGGVLPGEDVVMVVEGCFQGKMR